MIRAWRMRSRCDSRRWLRSCSTGRGGTARRLEFALHVFAWTTNEDAIMKFMLQLVPTVPASPIERERLRPISHRTEKIQQMLGEMVELAQLAEDVGFTAVTYSEHHFYTEGLEAGATPTPHLLNLLSKTKRMKVGPVGFVLPTWDPIRLALNVAWADQMSRGRVIVGL